MAITSRKTHLRASSMKGPDPKTGLLYSVDAGAAAGIQESHVQVPLGNAGTLSYGHAYDGTRSNARLHTKAINTRSDVAVV